MAGFYFLKKRREREQETVETMIRMYCRANHDTSSTLCEKCADLAGYARKRNARCIFGDRKPVCNACKVHCYKPSYREEIRKVMRFAGPRMIYTHPLMAVDHLIMKFVTRKYDKT